VIRRPHPYTGWREPLPELDLRRDDRRGARAAPM